MESLRALLVHPTCIEGTVNRSTPNNMTPLERAARTGPVLNVQLLLEHRADVNATRTENGFALLHSAVFCGHADVARVMIAARAEVDRKCLAERHAAHGHCRHHTLRLSGWKGRVREDAGPLRRAIRSE
jgi:ankyrin repeat protein